MCGIYGYIGNNAYAKVIEGLKLLQYRGYDSCGIAYYDNTFTVNKVVGTIENLPKINKNVNIAFGHTRWATNGKVNIQNAHPHISYDNSITIVHNGIIKNADKLKNELIVKGINFYSETDTEVIANYIAYKRKDNDIASVLKSLFTTMQGSYSLIIGTEDGCLYLVKKFSPLNVLISNNGVIVSSDMSSLEEGELYSLKDNDILMIKDNQISNLYADEIEFTHHKNEIRNSQLGIYKHYMEKEIHETPNAIHKTYDLLINNKIENKIKESSKITLIGCGTAYHSCLIGEYLFKNELNLNIETFLASNYSIKSNILNKHLHIIVSQSGETADCIKVAEQIKSFGGEMLLITNESKSTLAKMADYHIFTKAEKEIAVASTKTYCCQLFVFAYLCHRLKDKNYTINIYNFCEQLNEFINKVDIELVAEQLKNVDKLIMIAKDIDYVTMLEASLKIREIDYIYTLPMYSGELKHGTLSLIDENCHVLSLNSEHNDKLHNAINEIKSRKGRVVDFSGFIDKNISNYYKPIFAIIPFQLLSYKIAILNNRNPDMPRNLAKSVTVE